MADQSLLGPITILAGIAILVLAPGFLILHFRYQAKRRAQIQTFERLRAGAQ